MLYYNKTDHEASSVPKQLPVVDLNDKLTGTGWMKVPAGAHVKTWYQAYRFQPDPGWYISAYFTSEDYCNNGFSNYRRPASVCAWFTVICQLPRKYWRKFKGDL